MIGWIALVIIVAAAAFWAGTAVVRPEVKPLDQRSTAMYTVADGEVGRELSVTVTVTWPAGLEVVSPTGGTVTSIDIADGAAIDVGDTLFSVDLRPSVVAVGAVPAFRAISRGTEGADVEQLQQMLDALGYRSPHSGQMDRQTVAAVKKWQTDTGLPPDGVVHRGQVTFVPQLPVRLVAAETLTIGQHVSPGTVIARAITGEPTFTIALAPEQTTAIPRDGIIKITNGEHTWQGVVHHSQSDPQTGGIRWTITDPSGGLVCGDACGSIPVPGPVALPAKVVAIPPTRGPVVPIASVLSGPDGSTAVVLADGSQRRVTIRATDAGLAVVDGIDAGTRIQLFAPESQ